MTEVTSQQQQQHLQLGLPSGSLASAGDVGDAGSIARLGRSPGGGNSNPL